MRPLIDETSSQWSRWPNFSPEEFRCRHTRRVLMCPDFLDILQRIRTDFGKPMIITSGYRHPTHPVEARKGHTSGEHTTGRCADIAVQGADALSVLDLALRYGIRRVGVQQKGAGRFLHLGLGDRPGLVTPTIWSY